MVKQSYRVNEGLTEAAFEFDFPEGTLVLDQFAGGHTYTVEKLHVERIAVSAPDLPERHDEEAPSENVDDKKPILEAEQNTEEKASEGKRISGRKITLFTMIALVALTGLLLALIRKKMPGKSNKEITVQQSRNHNKTSH